MVELAWDAQHAGIALAFLAGLVSFVSPCVLPLVPAYLTYLGGEEAAQGRHGAGVRYPLVLRALAFVAGFSLVFILFGLSASAIGQFLQFHQTEIRKASGILIGALGLHLAGVIRLPYLDQTWRPVADPDPESDASEAGGGHAFALGAFFAAGWTPCVGPVLASIFLLAASTAGMWQGALLLGGYAMGLAVPFLLAALFFDRTAGVQVFLGRHGLAVERFAGVMLLGVGIMIYFNVFLMLSRYFNWSI